MWAVDLVDATGLVYGFRVAVGAAGYVLLSRGSLDGLKAGGVHDGPAGSSSYNDIGSRCSLLVVSNRKTFYTFKSWYCKFVCVSNSLAFCQTFVILFGYLPLTHSKKYWT